MFCHSESGDTKSTDKKFIDSCFAGHLNNIKRLAQQRKLIISGLFGKSEFGFRGLFVLNITTFEEAKQLLESDPAIHAG